MSLVDEILALQPIDWFVVGLTTAVSLLGMLLPKIGNLLGRLFLGEDPLLERWKHARAERKARIAAKKVARAERKAAAKAKP